MTPSARIKASLDLLEKFETSRIPMDGTVGDYMRFRRYIGAKDRAEIAERTYNIIRAHARLGWWLNHVKAADTPRMRLIAWLMLGEAREITAVQSLFDGDKYSPAPLNEEELALAQALNAKNLNTEKMPEAVRVECPPPYEKELRGYFGNDFAAELGAMIEGATLDIRVNIWRSDREAARQALEKDEIKTDSAPYCPWGLRARSKAFLSKTKAWQKGWIEIQDEGSQLIAYLCGAAPGMHILDYCAGGGGKTLALAAAMQNKGRLVAMDLDGGRLEKSRPRLKKAGVHDIVELRALSDEKNRKWLRRQKGAFDLVLADVPCTGTGTWRRNPDLRWRTYSPALEELTAVQADILDRVARVVKPGGRLVYATCSLLPAENEEQIAAFLERHNDFSVLPPARACPENENMSAIADKSGRFMRLTPHRHNTDGFFAAVLQRAP